MLRLDFCMADLKNRLAAKVWTYSLTSDSIRSFVMKIDIAPLHFDDSGGFPILALLK